jgi:riboflavin kinase/FMN adenylyltransferase
MKLIRRIEDFPADLRGGAITIGNFDGVHRGHKHIIQRVKQFAAQLRRPAVVFTFDPHPVRILRPDQCPPPLTWTDRKADLLAELGVEVMVAWPTNREVLDLSYQAFFQQIVVDKLGAKAIVEGPNFYFGKDRQGDVARLGELCEQHGLLWSVVNPVEEQGAWISSSRIRTMIAAGQVAEAREYLTQPYRIRGLVVHGAHRGSQLGFPTANLDGIDTLIPEFGVYAGRAKVDNRWHWAAIHIGPSPTFAERLPKVEVHLLDFEHSLYGQLIEVDFIERLRAVMHFSSAEELRRQLSEDLEATRQLARQLEL